MNIYLFAIASLILVVPIIYFLPLGLTKKGKIIVVSVSFVLSLIGVSANSLFEWWKLALLVFVLVILSSYLLDRKMKDLFLVSEHDNAINQLDFTSPPVEISLEKERNEIEESNYQDNMANMSHFEEEIEEINVENEDAHYVESSEISIIDNQEEDLLAELFLDTEIIKKMDEESEHVLIEEETSNHSSIEIVDNTDNGYLSELEKMMLDDPKESSFTMSKFEEAEEKNSLLFNELKENIQEQDADLLEVFSQFEDKEQITEMNVLTQEMPNIESQQQEDTEDYLEVLTQFELSKNEAASTNEQALNIEPDSLVVEELIEEEQQSETSIQPIEIQSLTFIKKEKNHLQKQIISTLLDQVKLAKETLDRNKYEQLLKECMHPSMPKLEYFTFASLLIEHYISTKDVIKLQNLLESLEMKYIEYPILMQQIQFLQTVYSEEL
ncbi:hypothetical protein J2Z40_001155 [Cytobacillus eiseniae]|uniref:MFS transporter n=1 Tax=Cytobacillus eiseniae TaxID=762947 RepID=A0ABS4RCG9_9BACI|nr:hypothetical protein [Cytobacillus eiseniae]MBP2240598.1 hypothetical protein [Cytobacillus eiseniae]